MNSKPNRREFIRTAGAVAAGTFLLGHTSLTAAAEDVFPVFTLDALPYAFNALEPHIDAMTMEIHHDRHHRAYVDNLNKAVIDQKITEQSLDKILSSVSKYSAAVRNNGGGHYNHTMFWKMLAPNGGGLPKGNLADAIESVYGSFDAFKTKFNDAAKSRFGSGWAWLVAGNGKLEISTTPNQDNPLMDVNDVKGSPVIALDVWEHAYYLKYQNKRADYINAFWNVINWNEAERRFVQAK